jgi:hypothetical protein
MATIVVLEHEVQRHSHPVYLSYILEREWRERGHCVLVHHGHENPPDADIAILHVDLTIIPAEYRALVPRYGRVINRSVLNIGKSTFSQCLVAPDAGWQGAVIVKTEENALGLPERRLEGLERPARLVQRLRRRLFWNSLMVPGPVRPRLRKYRIYPSLQHVPQRIWTMPGLIVEKFMPEQDRQASISVCGHFSAAGNAVHGIAATSR